MRLKCCCKYIKVPFLKASHNKLISVVVVVVANISKFLFWKRITTLVQRLLYWTSLLQIYQSSFFESESQQPCLVLFFFFSCCKYIKVPFLKANHNYPGTEVLIVPVVANISKFLFWKRITTILMILMIVMMLLQIYQSSFFESESQLVV